MRKNNIKLDKVKLSLDIDVIDKNILIFFLHPKCSAFSIYIPLLNRKYLKQYGLKIVKIKKPIKK